jgi:acetylornithine deacetylase
MKTTQDSTTKLLSDLIRFESLSHKEEEIAAYMARALDIPGVSIRRTDNNVVATLGNGGRAFLLNSHLDVVPASANHPYPPFSPTVSEGRLYGRGSVDAKASVASMATAFMKLSLDGWSPPVGYCLVAAFTACEEVGGGYNGLEAIRSTLPEIAAALIGEPTELAPCTAQKGMMILEATAKGKTAHAARAHLGTNAVEIAARDIVRLSEYSFDREHTLLGATIANATIIRGGSSHNVVPDRCEFTIDARLTPAYTSSEVLSIVQDLLTSEIMVRSDRYVPVETAPDSVLARAVIAASGREPFGSATASDWVYLRGTPTIKIGPGDSNLSHTPGESIDITELERAPAVYLAAIKNYFAMIND